MDVIDFVNKNIKELLNKNVECVRYGISKWTGAHIIEITPDSVYSSKHFLKIESSISSKFIELFPHEELIFISNDDIINLSDSEVLITKSRPVEFSLKLTDLMKGIAPIKIKGLENYVFNGAGEVSMSTAA